MDGFDAMILRVGYTNFLLNVARMFLSTHHTKSARLVGTIKHIVTPTLFFPEKAASVILNERLCINGVRNCGRGAGHMIGMSPWQSYVDSATMFAADFFSAFSLGSSIASRHSLAFQLIPCNRLFEPNL